MTFSIANDPGNNKRRARLHAARVSCGAAAALLPGIVSATMLYSSAKLKMKISSMR